MGVSVIYRKFADDCPSPSRRNAVAIVLGIAVAAGA